MGNQVPPSDEIKFEKKSDDVNENGRKSYLKYNIDPNDFIMSADSKISSGTFGDVLKVTLKSNPSNILAVKVMNINSSDEKCIAEINNEMDLLIKFLKKK